MRASLSSQIKKTPPCLIFIVSKGLKAVRISRGTDVCATIPGKKKRRENNILNHTCNVVPQNWWAGRGLPMDQSHSPGVKTCEEAAQKVTNFLLLNLTSLHSMHSERAKGTLKRRIRANIGNRKQGDIENVWASPSKSKGGITSELGVKFPTLSQLSVLISVPWAGFKARLFVWNICSTRTRQCRKQEGWKGGNSDKNSWHFQKALLHYWLAK